VGCVQMDVATEEVAVLFAERPIGRIDRRRLRTWLNQPRGSLRFEDVRLESAGRNLYVYLGIAPPCLMPPDVKAQLLAVV
jgi:hypothetical protein